MKGFATIDTAELVDHVDENGNLTEGEWQKDITGNFFQLLPTLGSGRNTKTYAKAIRGKIRDYNRAYQPQVSETEFLNKKMPHIFFEALYLKAFQNLYAKP